MRAFSILVLMTGCWQSEPARTPERPTKKPQPAVDLARTSYNMDVGVVYAATLEAARARYPTLEEDPTARRIKSAWHRITPPDDEPAAADRRYFMRVDIGLEGPPWLVTIDGHVARWQQGDAIPTEIVDGRASAWKAERVYELRKDIHERLARPE